MPDNITFGNVVPYPSVMLGISAVGTIVSGTVLMLVLCRGCGSTRTGMNAVALLLVGVSCGAGLFQAVTCGLLVVAAGREGFWDRLGGIGYLVLQVTACISMLAFFSCNAALAVERWLCATRCNASTRLTVHKLQWAFFLMASSAVVICLGVSPVTPLLIPTNPVLYFVWIAIMGTAFIASCIATIVFHRLSYLEGARLLTLTLSPIEGKDHTRRAILIQKLDGKMRMRCLLMNVVVVVCQTPLMLLRGIIFILQPPVDEIRVLLASSTALQTIETVVTPLLIIYFFPLLREAVLSKPRFCRKRGTGVGVLNEGSLEREEERMELEAKSDVADNTGVMTFGLDADSAGKEPKFGIMKVVAGSLSSG
ncbi:hypothetical protein BC830DRAFT_1094481, partial [Chytriomyces sp. MP71]